MDLVHIRGRGAADNPHNRFERLSLTPDEEARNPGDSGPRTRFYRDTSRSALSRNDSPDIGFRFSLNPYRGCEHGCSYCLSGDTAILMADGTTRALKDLRVGDAIYGTIRDGWYRRFTPTRVLAHWRTLKPAYRISLGDGTTLVASSDHRFLTERGWKHVTGARQGAQQRPHLTNNNKLMGVGAFASCIPKTSDYERGYLCGLIRGDGHLASYAYERVGRAHGNQHQFRLALADEEALRRAGHYLSGFGVLVQHFLFQDASLNRRAMHGIRTHARGQVDAIRGVIAWPSGPSTAWYGGFLAGIFDAEGSRSAGAFRIPNTDNAIVDCVVRGLEHFGFSFILEAVDRARVKPIRVVRLRGGLREQLRFFHTVDPAITRKRDLTGLALKGRADLRVSSVEPLDIDLPLFDITTGTGDFIANGVVSHNCYARPTHEYLGWSAGLDFESRILVKEDAPDLLRAALSSRRWKPETIALSGVTDPYQPAERRLRVTRRCLEVLAEFRNPVAIITKNHLVTRDVDLLAELARHGAAAVHLSITSLDAALQRQMEPRTATPARRLDAVRRLSDVGIPVGVMVAPVVPGLTDHEMPAILEAAADAGARTAGYTPLRLPHGVADLFADWLERCYPDRKEKVLNRVRSLRGGKLNDPRFTSRMRGEGVFAEQLRTMFTVSRRKAGLGEERLGLSTAAFRRAGVGDQLGLFE